MHYCCAAIVLLIVGAVFVDAIILWEFGLVDYMHLRGIPHLSICTLCTMQPVHTPHKYKCRLKSTRL